MILIGWLKSYDTISWFPAHAHMPKLYRQIPCWKSVWDLTNQQQARPGLAAVCIRSIRSRGHPPSLGLRLL